MNDRYRVKIMFYRQKMFVYLFFITYIAFLSFSGETNAESRLNNMSAVSESPIIHWYEYGRKRVAWISENEIALFPERGEKKYLNIDSLAQQFHGQGLVKKQNDFVIFFESPETINRKEILDRLSAFRSLEQVKQSCPVFYMSKEKSPYTKITPTSEIIVRFPANYSEKQISRIEDAYGLERLLSLRFTKNLFLYRLDDPFYSIDVANHLYETGSAVYAYPNFLRTHTKRVIPDDPLFSIQWHLENTGQNGGTAGEDMNVVSVWDIYLSSANEVIAVVDDGLEIAHEDLEANVIEGQSYDYIDGDTDPTGGDHGTAVAGLAAGRGFNGIGIVGIAPFAGLVGHRFIGAETDVIESDALTRNYNFVDIYSNSWGPTDNGRNLTGPGPLTEDAIIDGTTNGRNGLGSVYVWAGGNGNESGDNSNYDGYANSRYTIAVATSDNKGIQASYSEKGANIVVNVPSDGVPTTDRTGGEGYDTGNYFVNFDGTSAAAPLVAGTIALMLEVNPNLSWRDVQHILIRTAEMNDPYDTDWELNGAGYHINHKYGFGRVNVQDAVDTAISWQTVETELTVEGRSVPDIVIPDNDPVGVTDTITISDNITVEFVEVYFASTDHNRWGDLEITLISPDGTVSKFAETHNTGSAYKYDNWRFGSVRHYGETSAGTWTLQVKDLKSDQTGTFQSWKILIYGTTSENNTTTPTPVLSPAPSVTPSPLPDDCEAEVMTVSTEKLKLKKKASEVVTITIMGKDNCLVENVEVKAKIKKGGKRRMTISPEHDVTDANGEIDFTITAKKKGKAIVKFKAEGLTETLIVKIKE